MRSMSDNRTRSGRGARALAAVAVAMVRVLSLPSVFAGRALDPVYYRGPNLGPFPSLNASYSKEFTGSCNQDRTTVRFFDNASGGLPPYNYSWVFGDGSPPSFEQNTGHSFPSDATYQVRVTVTDSAGYSNGSILSTLVLAPPPSPRLPSRR